MTEEIKDLIAKIQAEGVQAAQAKADEVKAQANILAQKIISDDKLQAKKILEQAEFEAKRTEDATEATLKQAGRDLLISLRKEINFMLDKIIKTDIRHALGTEELVKIITNLIKDTKLSSSSEIEISLNSHDKEKLEKGFLKQLIQETAKKIVLKSNEGIEAGFVISFDSGKSVFDFSSQALAEYISTTLHPELAKLLKS